MAKKRRKATFTSAVLQRKPKAAKKQLHEVGRIFPGAAEAARKSYRRKHGTII